MKKVLAIVLMLVLATSLMFALVACEKPGPELEGTAAVVAEASKMTLAELEAASKKEMEASKDTFKIVGLTSVLQKAAKSFSEKYDWITIELDKDGKIKEGGNTFVNNGYKDDLTLDRIDPTGNYTPDNCRWADYITQANNKRNSKHYLYNGESLSAKQLSRKYCVSEERIRGRIKKGMDINEIMDFLMSEQNDKVG